MNGNISIGEKQFKPLISNTLILNRIKEMALEMNWIFEHQNIDILVILDGAETFAKAIHPLLTFENRIHFIRVKTYDGMSSRAEFNMDLAFIELLKGKDVLILEDIIDSGFTIFQLSEKFKEFEIRPFNLATLLLKPNQLKYPINPDFTGFEIGPEFVIGFGMDYDEQGRELPDIYSCINP